MKAKHYILISEKRRICIQVFRYIIKFSSQNADTFKKNAYECQETKDRLKAIWNFDKNFQESDWLSQQFKSNDKNLTKIRPKSDNTIPEMFWVHKTQLLDWMGNRSYDFICRSEFGRVTTIQGSCNKGFGLRHPNNI